MTERCDVVLAGGGLASSLIALRLKALRPELKVVVLDRATASRDDHTWSFFATDVGAAFGWLGEMTEAVWPSYDVSFPRFERRLTTAYASLREGRLRQTLAVALGDDLRLGTEVERLTDTHVVRHDGEVIEAKLVIDGRGARPTPHLRLGWQKFSGLELILDRPHGLAAPVVMDATVPQLDGFRFIYLLPFAPLRLLVEDTRYSDGPAIDLAALEDEVLAYAGRRDLPVAQVHRREHGVLPVVLGGDIDAYWADAAIGPAAVGVRAALFHPTTGYSLPEAVHTAEAIATAPVLASREISTLTQARSRRLWRQGGFYRMINRMMFKAAAPEARYRVLERFYTLPQPLIERFYANRLTVADQLRILAGKPPVPIGKAIRALREETVHAA